MTTMRKQKFYIALRPATYDGLRGRIGQSMPRLDAGEIALELNVEVPSALFQKPTLRASVAVPEDAVTAPTVSAEVLDNVRAVLEQQTGMRIEVALVEPTVTP